MGCLELLIVIGIVVFLIGAVAELAGIAIGLVLALIIAILVAVFAGGE